jgi:hypothetical protein
MRQRPPLLQPRPTRRWSAPSVPFWARCSSEACVGNAGPRAATDPLRIGGKHCPLVHGGYGWISSLPKRLGQVLRTEGAHIVNLVGNLILTHVHRFAPSFLFTRIFERFGDDEAGRVVEEINQAAVAGVVAQLRQRVSRRAPGA